MSFFEEEHHSEKSLENANNLLGRPIIITGLKVQCTTGAKMGMSAKIFRQRKRKSKVTNKYYKEFAVVTISRFRKAILEVSLYSIYISRQSHPDFPVNCGHPLVPRVPFKNTQK